MAQNEEIGTNLYCKVTLTFGDANLDGENLQVFQQIPFEQYFGTGPDAAQGQQLLQRWLWENVAPLIAGKMYEDGDAYLQSLGINPASSAAGKEKPKK